MTGALEEFLRKQKPPKKIILHWFHIWMFCRIFEQSGLIWVTTKQKQFLDNRIMKNYL